MSCPCGMCFVKPSVLDLSIDNLDISGRTWRALQCAGIDTVGQLVKLTENRLRVVKHLGPIGIAEIKRKLARLGLQLTVNPRSRRKEVA